METKKANELISLNACLDILDGCDLGLSLVWLWTWSTIKSTMEDEDYEFNLTEDEIWNKLVEAVEAGHGFTLEYGAEDHQQDVVNWLLENEYATPTLMEEE